MRPPSLSLATLVLCCGAAMAVEPAVPSPQIEVLFSPNGGCTDAIVKQIAAARSSVRVQAYWFTSAPIAKALAAAHHRKVKVEVILDASRTEMDGTQADYLADQGVPTYTDAKHKTAHSKLMIMDEAVIITGSFNFTGQSEDENAENLLIIRDKPLAAKYVANWKTHFEHAVRYVKP